MNDLDLAIHGFWLSGLQVLGWMGLIAHCVVLLLDLVHDRTRDWHAVWMDLSLVLAAASILDGEIDPSRLPIRLLASFVLLGVLVGRRWQRAESQPA